MRLLADYIETTLKELRRYQGRLPTTYYLLPTTYYLLPTTYYLLPPTYYLPTTYYHLPTTTYQLPTTTNYYSLLAAHLRVSSQ
jgi:hypothetical protein